MSRDPGISPIVAIAKRPAGGMFLHRIGGSSPPHGRATSTKQRVGGWIAYWSRPPRRRSRARRPARLPSSASWCRPSTSGRTFRFWWRACSAPARGRTGRSFSSTTTRSTAPRPRCAPSARPTCGGAASAASAGAVWRGEGPRARPRDRRGGGGGGGSLEGMLGSQARYVAVMDADLQHDETLLAGMLARLRQGDVELAGASPHAGGGGGAEVVG